MVRGADGLLRLGGARPYETPLLLDGFNVTNPATGTSSINLPFESVQGVEVLRDPMAVTYSGLLGGLVQMVSKPGGEKLQFGVQGFIPRPRFVSPGFGRLEGIFPRVYAGGATCADASDISPLSNMTSSGSRSPRSRRAVAQIWSRKARRSSAASMSSPTSDTT